MSPGKLPPPGKSRRPPAKPVNVCAVPGASRVALRMAMTLEGVPAEQFDDFVWLMAHESCGVVNARNPRSSARGLFQLLRDQYALNPHGEASFGNAIEECQGGIR